MMSVRIRIIAGDPLPCSEILRAAFIGMSLQKHASGFRGATTCEEIRQVTNWVSVRTEKYHFWADFHDMVAYLSLY